MTLSPPPLTRAQIARIRTLYKDKAAREAEGTFLMEGAKVVLEVLARQANLVHSVVVTPGYLRRERLHERRLRTAGSAPSYSCPDHTFATLSGLDSPQGILAVVRRPSWNEAEVFARTKLLGLFGEHLQDPANVGAIIRTASALGAGALWLTPESADIYNPKVVRATSGAVLSLPVFIAADTAPFLRHGCTIFAAEAGGRGTVAINSIRAVPRRLILVLGNESRGLSERTVKQASCRFTIPLSRRVESLNVAATAAITLYYFRGLPEQR